MRARATASTRYISQCVAGKPAKSALDDRARAHHRGRHASAVNTLLENGANANTSDQRPTSDMSALHTAVTLRKTEMWVLTVLPLFRTS